MINAINNKVLSRFYVSSASKAKKFVSILDANDIEYDMEVDTSTLEFVFLVSLTQEELALIKEKDFEYYVEHIAELSSSAINDIQKNTLAAASKIAPVITGLAAKLATTTIGVAAIVVNSGVNAAKCAKQELNSNPDVRTCMGHFKD